MQSHVRLLDPGCNYLRSDTRSWSTVVECQMAGGRHGSAVAEGGADHPAEPAEEREEREREEERRQMRRVQPEGRAEVAGGVGDGGRRATGGGRWGDGLGWGARGLVVACC